MGKSLKTVIMMHAKVYSNLMIIIRKIWYFRGSSLARVFLLTMNMKMRTSVTKLKRITVITGII